MSKGKLVAVLRLAAVPAIVAAAVTLAWRLGYFDLDRRQNLVELVHELRSFRWTEAVYVVAYGIALAFLLPATIPTIVGGALFGPAKGAALAWAGALFGTAITHLIARYVARAPMKRVFGEHRLLRRLREKDDVAGLFRLRLLPVAPFGTLDYVAGVAGVSLRRLLLATMMGVIPSVIAYSYVGSEIMRGIVSRTASARGPLLIAVGVTVLMFTLSLVPGLRQRSTD